MVTKMSKAGKPISDDELVRGINTSIDSLRTRIASLRRKLRPHGVTVTMNQGGAKKRARYELEEIA
ncbi:hypothetical protein [Mesorhizobium sp. B2-3-2]|uniref:hypothetical protein n=1 Tax=Mesorhizobium sp. B2-3-2 TaxID=2589961 RepID=UPI00112AA054|nr:hypothetical protein [Mesorhizobium sp. B2-3-2]TPM37037.1 hypothetical protein FJ964_30345 [Mesorhizobium sp. B2-3-2]